jgi:hypothetical protein
MLIVNDRVKEFSVTEGTGNFTLGGTSGAFESFASSCSINDTFWYCIAEQTGVQWEVGKGTYVSANTIRRDTIYSSSNGNTFVSFTAGVKDVFITVAAHIVRKITEISPNRLVGRVTAGVGELEELTAAQVKTLLSIDIADISGLISTQVDNRLNTGADDGLFVPELTVDPLSYYILAKS